MATETIDIKEALLSNIKNQVSGKNNENFLPLEIKKEALEAISKLDLPTAKNEEWKYTDISKALKKNFDFTTSQASIHYSSSQIQAYKFAGLDAYHLVFVNGKFEKELSNLPSEDKKINVELLSSAISTHADLFKLHFAKHLDFNKDIFAALSTAFVQDGILLKIGEGAVVEKPFVFIFISDSTQGNTITQPRNLVYISKNSSATIIENYVSVGANPQFTNIVSEMIVEENAHLHLYKFQHESDQSYHVGTTQVYQARNSNFTATTITTDGGMVRNNLNIKLDGENANAYMFGLYLLNGKTHVDNHTSVDHAKPHAYSNELYKGIMDGKSTGVFNGKIFVRQDAQKTNAFQSNRNILLSDDASVNTKPQLEIWADDVKCSHGATTGQIDEEALFYLQSRGISKDTAKALLMIAFASEIVNEIKVPEVKTHIEQLIHQLLHR